CARYEDEYSDYYFDYW
nr:immunoglobulin heavy chain junction region [Macaca mulatta]MOX59458.1 immunoglobulin heavy chain junction region [Macaca mulatta]MOX59847.1 immunoglobulin heavy chain junction region [Macaca mulatta]MOX60873.1 immunoglobulin heavy chain junction region [Macaca mulatta]MOX61000.1 immunoglobulin heavy chain junction region [Macaca mulatta]